mmetsp:Transcript_33953/g.109278  ORF Transcript_33953/g.109278 Transcript_33953/m.109278 type:complete len:256 (-) Transcript_33953:11-778(-)
MVASVSSAAAKSRAAVKTETSSWYTPRSAASPSSFIFPRSWRAAPLSAPHPLSSAAYVAAVRPIPSRCASAALQTSSASATERVTAIASTYASSTRASEASPLAVRASKSSITALYRPSFLACRIPCDARRPSPPSPTAAVLPAVLPSAPSAVASRGTIAARSRGSSGACVAGALTVPLAGGDALPATSAGSAAAAEGMAESPRRGSVTHGAAAATLPLPGQRACDGGRISPRASARRARAERGRGRTREPSICS